MRLDRFRQVETLFHRLVDAAPAEREALLDRECAGDPALRSELEGLLQRDEQLGPTDPGAPEGAAFDPVPERGATVGPYRVRRLIARGGMGLVYEAEQLEPIRRTVALKLVRGGLDSARIVARFEIERQALALMDHPNVARVYDAGVSSDGRPYFAMELVDGRPLTEFCLRGDHSLEQRLELFLGVCDGVHHAHQKGLIHRDLKPSNILVHEVEGRPVPKVIDFGVAKAVDPTHDWSTTQTAAGDLVGTPEYMSPEQSSGDGDVDTRSDVYALGVVLYELLTGKHPFRDDDGLRPPLDEVLRRVRTETPLRPSARPAPTTATDARRLRGDLDWIVLRAMEKDRARRYASVAEFADDIRRHLRDEPVLAGPPSRAYRMRKFASRHRVAVIVAGLLTVSVVGGGIGVTVALFYKDRAEERARRDAEIANRTSQFLLDVFEGANVWSVGSEPPTVLDVTDRAAADLLADRRLDEGIRAALMRDVGAVYVTQSRFDRARPLLEEAVRLYESDPSLSRVRFGRALMRLAQLEAYEGRFDAAVALGERAEAAIVEGGAERAPIRGVAVSVLGGILLDAGRGDRARETLRRAVESLRPHAGEYDPELATALINLAKTTRDPESAEALAEEAAELYAGALPPGHPHHAEAPKFIAAQRYAAGDIAGAAEAQGRAVDAMLEALAPSHWAAAWEIRMHAGYLLFSLQVDAARASLQRSIDAVVNDLGDADPTLGGLYNDLAFVEQVAGRLEEAERHARRSLEILDATAGRVHPDTALTLHTLGDVVSDRSRQAEALELYEETRRVRAELGPFEESPYAPILYEAYARAYRRAGDLDAAGPAIEAAIRLYEAAGWDPFAPLRSRMAKATLLARRGSTDEARAAFDAALQAMRALPGSGSMYDWRDEVLFQAVAGDDEAFTDAARRAVEAGVPGAFLAAEPEVRDRAANVPAAARLLTRG